MGEVVDTGTQGCGGYGVPGDVGGYGGNGGKRGGQMEDAFGTGKAPVGVFGGGPLSLFVLRHK